MSGALDDWRREIRALIPRGFLRRDQGNGLFISDYPRFENAEKVTEALNLAGFLVSPGASLALIDGGFEKYQILFSHLPPQRAPSDDNLMLWGLGKRLERYGGETREEDMPLLRAILKYLDGENFAALQKELRPVFALSQRMGRPLPAMAGKLILSYLPAPRR